MELKLEVEKKESTTPSREVTPLEKHIRYFGGNKPEGISYTSISQQNESLGKGWLAARSNAAAVMTGAGIKISGCPFAMFKAKQAVGVLNHPQSTRIFNLDGTINENRWSELLAFAEENETGTLVISEKNLYKFIGACRLLDNRSDPTGFYLATSNVEWSGFLADFADTDAKGKRFVPIERLRKFYENSQEVGEEVEQRVGKTL